MMRGALLAATALMSACGAGAGPISEVRFENRPPVTAVDDRRHTPEPPDESPEHVKHTFDALLYHPLMRGMAVPAPARAQNTNALGNVPDSTWFTNRIGVRNLTPREVFEGPARGDDPEAHRPWTVLSPKASGAAAGLVIEDTRGIEYFLKFDDPEIPEMESGAHIITHRLLWAIGYHVPDDQIVELRRRDLVLPGDPDADGRRPMTEDDLDNLLRAIHVEEDGTIRALISKVVPGRPLDEFPHVGTRPGDPNDLVRHEMRRDLRGQLPIFAWLKRADTQHNALDSYVRDPEDPDRRYLVHYQIDFGRSLGVFAYEQRMQSSGLAHAADLSFMTRSLLSLGLWKRPWEDLQPVGIRGVGLYHSEPYDPELIRPYVPYIPLKTADRFDAYWGAKLMMRLRPAHIRAAVEAAQFSDPRATEYLVQTLIARQRITARHYFGLVAPLDGFDIATTAKGLRLCFDDLAIRYRLADPDRRTRYRLSAFAYTGEPTGWQTSVTATASGRVCVHPLELSAGPEAYTIVNIVTRRPGQTLPPTQVHLARAPDTGEPRVIGLWRE